MYLDKFEILNVDDGIEGNKRVQIKTGEEEGDNLIIDIPEWELAAVMTETPSDSSEVRNKSAIVVVDKIYDLLKEMNIRIEDVSYIIQKLLSKLSGIEEKKTNELLGVEDKYEVRIKNLDN